MALGKMPKRVTDLLRIVRQGSAPVDLIALAQQQASEEIQIGVIYPAQRRV